MIIYDEFKTQESLDVYLKHICKEVMSSYPLQLLKGKIPNFKWDVCVDMGANVGAFSILAANHFKNVYAFEPGYLACLNAKHNAHYICKKNNVQIFNLAVSDITGKLLKLNCVLSEGKYSSGNNTLYMLKDNAEYEMCLTIAANSIFELIKADYIDYLKIDVEGAEYDILYNMDLSKVGIIVGELHVVPVLDKPTWCPSKLLEYLETDFDIVANEAMHNFFAIQKKYNIRNTELKTMRMG